LRLASSVPLKSVVEFTNNRRGSFLGAAPRKLDVTNMIRGGPLQELKVTRFPSARKI